MRVVITGSSQAASFSIRGRQLGGAIGAAVMHDAPLDVLKSADVVVVIKRARPRLVRALQSCRRPIVWDALDFFDQRDASPRDVLIGKAKALADELGATAIIGATQRMADDLGSPYHLAHHGWDRGRAVIREKLGLIAYEGAGDYIAEERGWIDQVCEAHGARFIINPGNYLSADIIFAGRAGMFDTYATRNWKSGVKLANAQIAGIPFVGRRECGYFEQSSGAELWAEDGWQLSAALSELADPIERGHRADIMFDAAPRLGTIANAFRRILERIA